MNKQSKIFTSICLLFFGIILLSGCVSNFEIRNKDGYTKLMQALRDNETPRVIRSLIEKGADVNDQLTGPHATGWTALMFASSNEKPDLVKYLISKEADVNLKAKDGATALSLAQKEKNDDIIKLLKAAGAKE